MSEQDFYQHDRQQLLKTLQAQGINSEMILQAIERIPRHLFVPPEQQDSAYLNQPLPIGHDQTISQPYIVAKMTELLLQAGPLAKVLEVGSGSGYQAAILASLVDQVYTIERRKILYEMAKHNLAKVNITNVQCIYGDGYLGWPQQAPYDGIIVTAAAEKIPDALLEQMAVGGRMIIPVGDVDSQSLQLIVRDENGYHISYYDPVRFVPMLEGKE